MQDPTTFLAALEIDVPAWDDSTRLALLEPSNVGRVNHDVFLFASVESKARFETAPFDACESARDPVTLTAFRPTETSPTERVGERLFVFESDQTRAQFAAQVDSFAVPRWTMRPATP